VLAEVLPDGLDFVLLVSSLSTTVGGAGLLAYAAANQFLDAFARVRGAPWIAVGLDAWAPAAGNGPQAIGVERSKGCELLTRIVARPDAHGWVVSTVPLERRMADADKARAPAAASPLLRAPAERHPRPEMPNAFVAPRSETEKVIQAIWEEVLGIDGVGAEDSFFKLGGDSLMAIQISTRLRDALDVEIPVNELFKEPTVAGAARAVEGARQNAATAPDALADALAKVEAMSDEEVRRMLAELEAGA
jgi:acyl carrier protein